jgi:hypothetical protein
MNAISLMILFVFQAVSPAAILDAPEPPGIYVRQNNAAWIKLQPAQVIESKTKGLAAYVQTDGYTNLNVSGAYRGAKASLRISDYKPVFFVRETGSSKNFTVIRLESKKDRRTFQAAPSAATMDNKLGFRKIDIVKMVIVAQSGHSFSATPEDVLKPGEYLMIFDSITSGYDFGMD